MHQRDQDKINQENHEDDIYMSDDENNQDKGIYENPEDEIYISDDETINNDIDETEKEEINYEKHDAVKKWQFQYNQSNQSQKSVQT